MIEIKNLTKDYGNGRGIFDVNLHIHEGETLGIVGTNGAGKTTLLRCLMGFLVPTSGTANIDGYDAIIDNNKIKSFVGYVPGEIAFPELRSGMDFLRSQAEMLGMQDLSRAEEIVHTLRLDTSADLKRMSKGMKQKTALVEAFMNSPRVLLLDEPTTGLDPLMRENFVSLALEAKAQDATTIITSHLYEELEELCDRVALIEQGHIKNIVSMHDIQNHPYKEYRILFKADKDKQRFLASRYKGDTTGDEVTVKVHKRNIDTFIKDLSTYKIKYLIEVKYSLEKYFNDYILKSEKK